MEGAVTPRDIFVAVGNGLLSTPTAETFLEKLKTTSKEKDISKSPEYKDAETHIKNMLKTTGILDKWDPAELPRTEHALDEFDARVRAGEPIRQVRDDIVMRYRPSLPTMEELPRPLFGSKDDLSWAFKRTEQAYEAGEIDTQTYRREMINLYNLLTIQETWEKIHGTGPSKASEKERKSVEKQLKERESKW
jgi:hypothetical protein